MNDDDDDDDVAEYDMNDDDRPENVNDERLSLNYIAYIFADNATPCLI